LSFAFLNAAPQAPRPKSQATKPEANGKATRWHGYAAREGFGTTRIKNHISDTSPAMGSVHINQRYFLLRLGYLPIFGQAEGVCLLLKSCIYFTSITLGCVSYLARSTQSRRQIPGIPKNQFQGKLPP
jgi:hypothetical protein